jgi:hypothetical protein
MTTMPPMAARACALENTAVLIVRLHQAVMLQRIALDTEKLMMWIKLMAATAVVRMISGGTTAPFHHRAAANTIAMDMPLSTLIVEMDANATVIMDGPAKTARPHQRELQQRRQR